MSEIKQVCCSKCGRLFYTDPGGDESCCPCQQESVPTWAELKAENAALRENVRLADAMADATALVILVASISYEGDPWYFDTGMESFGWEVGGEERIKQAVVKLANYRAAQEKA